MVFRLKFNPAAQMQSRFDTKEDGLFCSSLKHCYTKLINIPPDLSTSEFLCTSGIFLHASRVFFSICLYLLFIKNLNFKELKKSVLLPQGKVCIFRH